MRVARRWAGRNTTPERDLIGRRAAKLLVRGGPQPADSVGLTSESAPFPSVYFYTVYFYR